VVTSREESNCKQDWSEALELKESMETAVAALSIIASVLLLIVGSTYVLVQKSKSAARAAMGKVLSIRQYRRR
jgi:hypothetical protein